MSRKVPIHISDEWQKEIDELAHLMGMDKQVYGYIPRTLRFSIALALASIRMESKVILDLKPEQLDLFFSSIRKQRNRELAARKAMEASEMARKV